MDKFVRREPRQKEASPIKPAIVLSQIPRFAKPVTLPPEEEEGEEEVEEDRDEAFEQHWQGTASRRVAFREARKKRDAAPRTIAEHFAPEKKQARADLSGGE